VTRPAYRISGGQQMPPEEPLPPSAGEPLPAEPTAAYDPFAPPAPSPVGETTPREMAHPAEPPAVEEAPAGEPRSVTRTVNALSAKLSLLAERMKAQESASARNQAALDRLESTLGEVTKRTQPMLETLSAELARQGAMLESMRTDMESALDLQGQRVNEFEHRLASVLREMRELVAAKIESFDLTVEDRLDQARATFADQLSTFQDQVEQLVRRYANEAIPDELRNTIEDLSARFVHAETALAATRSSVEFLRGEVGSLTMTVRKLGG
jgi:hypothetical protein